MNTEKILNAVIAVSLAFVLIQLVITTNPSVDNTTLSQGETLTGEELWGDEKQLTGEEIISISESGNYSLRANLESIGDRSNLSITMGSGNEIEKEIDIVEETLNTPYKEINGSQSIRISKSCTDCYFIDIADFEIVEKDASYDRDYLIGKNWYNRLEIYNHDWSRGNSTLYIYHDGNTKEEKEIALWISSFAEPRDVRFTLNNQTFVDTIPPETVQATLKTELYPGENILELETSSPCIEKGSYLNNDDIRCVTLGFQTLSLE